MHGALGSAEQLDLCKAPLSSTFNVHCITFEGHGGIPSDKDFSMELFSQNVLDYMEENNVSAAHCFGYSMGGYVALTLAGKHPERVLNIITLGTKFAWSPGIAAKETKMLNPEVIETKVPHFGKMLSEVHAPLDWKVNMKKTAAMMTRLGAGDGLSDSDLKQIEHKVTILIGSKDTMVTLEESARTAALLPNGKSHVLEDVPHPIEQMNFQLLLDTLSVIHK